MLKIGSAPVQRGYFYRLKRGINVENIVPIWGDICLEDRKWASIEGEKVNLGGN